MSKQRYTQSELDARLKFLLGTILGLPIPAPAPTEPEPTAPEATEEKEVVKTGPAMPDAHDADDEW